MLAEKLAERGHEVVWWISSFDHQKKKLILADDQTLPLFPSVIVKSLRGIPYNKNFSIRRYMDHRIIARKFRERAVAMPRPDLIVTAMPDYHLAWEAVAFAQKQGIPVIVDIRDPWPDVFFLHVPPILRPFLRWALHFDYRKLKRTLQGADAITSMVSDWLDWGLAKAGRYRTWKDKVFLIGAPQPDSFSSGAIPERLAPILRAVKGKFVVTFIGTFNRNYEPTVLVEAAAILQERKELQGRIAFILAGDGVFFQRVKERATGMKNIFLPGWVNREEMEAIQAVSSVGVVPSVLPTEAFPNKAFGYFSAGLPVLSSNDGDLPRMLAEHDAGYHFERNNQGQLADLILKLTTDPDLHERMSRNARNLFVERLDADRIYTSFVDHLMAVAAAKHSTTAEQPQLHLVAKEGNGVPQGVNPF
jgi:glycosyltransferase involved in cell wall biosynthesis